MNMIRTISLLLVTFSLLATLSGRQVWAEVIADEVEEEGVIHELMVDTNSVVINGVSFRVAYDARVQIRGSHGAFTLLRTGMKVAYAYRDFGDDREIYHISQLPDNTAIEES